MKNVGEWRRRSLIGLIVVAMVVGLYFGFRPRPVLVEMGAVTRGPMRVSVEQEGRTRVIDRYVVSAPVSGYARRITQRPHPRGSSPGSTRCNCPTE